MRRDSSVLFYSLGHPVGLENSFDYHLVGPIFRELCIYFTVFNVRGAWLDAMQLILSGKDWIKFLPLLALRFHTPKSQILGKMYVTF